MRPMLKIVASYDKNGNMILPNKHYDFLPLQELLEEILNNLLGNSTDTAV